MTSFQVSIPSGAYPGSEIEARDPVTKQSFRIKVPDGFYPGMCLQIQRKPYQPRKSTSNCLCYSLLTIAVITPVIIFFVGPPLLFFLLISEQQVSFFVNTLLL